MIKQGLFITLEGGEGAGKTTQINLLAEMFRGQGKQVLITREPSDPEIRKLLVTGDPNRWSKEEEVLFLMVDRSKHCREVIWPAIKQGQIVICDRFQDSTMAYQGYGEGDDKNIQSLITNLYSKFMGDFKPALTILLDIPVEIGLKRSMRPTNKEIRFESKKVQFHENLRRAYLAMAEAEPKRFLKIDANQTEKKVFQDIVNGMAQRKFFLNIQKAGAEEESIWMPPSKSR